MLSEFVLFAVQRILTNAQRFALPLHTRELARLTEIASSPHLPSARSWAALLLSATEVAPSQLIAVRESLSRGGQARPPPDELVATIGFSPKGDSSQEHTPHETKQLVPRLVELGLNDHTIAEILLAVAGEKVSRITAPIATLKVVASMLHGDMFASANQIRPNRDEHLQGFSNIAHPINEPTDGDPTEHERHAYLGGNFSELALISVLDQLNLGGEFFGIPRCCQRFFGESWNKACLKYDGDLAYYLIQRAADQANSKRLEFPWQCNPYAMYLGSGLLSHFPCSLDCLSTIERMNTRWSVVANVDSKLADRCRRAQMTPVSVAPDRRFDRSVAPADAIRCFPRDSELQQAPRPPEGLHIPHPMH